MLEPHGNDGLRAYRDLHSLVREEQTRQFSRKLFYFGGAGTAFSLFNITRFGQLSSTGRSAAIGGVLFFSYFTYCAATRSGMIGAPKTNTEAVNLAQATPAKE